MWGRSAPIVNSLGRLNATDKASGIVNDPNDWSREVGDPRYILNLLARVVTVSVETMKIVDSLPPIVAGAEQA
jgi:predicted helicase